MKITKRGVPPQQRIWKGRCHNCATEAEASEGEMKNITADQREGTFFSREECPVCKGPMFFYPVRE